MPAASDSITLTTDARDFQRLFARSSEVPAALRTSLRRNIRQAGNVAADDVRRTVMQPPRQQGAEPVSRGLRSGIAGGVKVTILTGNTRMGVAIRSTGFLARAYDKPDGWRHPVFGNRAAWVRQLGRPYFHTVIPAHRDQVTRAVVGAMTEAVKSLESK